jgi:hypothetical protein
LKEFPLILHGKAQRDKTNVKGSQSLAKAFEYVAETLKVGTHMSEELASLYDKMRVAILAYENGKNLAKQQAEEKKTA